MESKIHSIFLVYSNYLLYLCKSKRKRPKRGLFLNVSIMKERIKQIMDSQHMTQQVFADFIGIAPATLSNIFNDKTRPTLNIVEAIKKKISDINIDWLMFGTGDMYVSSQFSPDAASSPTLSSVEGELIFDQPTSPSTVSSVISPVQAAQPASYQGGVRNTHPSSALQEVKIVDKPPRHVTEIRVYYDDQTWESFVPASGTNRR